MPNTPQVKFNFTNNNVQTSVPLLGVSHVIARTTKGPFNDPSTLIRSFPQFQNLFGEEIVPDGTVSNIKKALELGSILRVSRVAGYQGAQYGYASLKDAEAEEDEIPKADLGIMLVNPEDQSYLIFHFNIKTAEAGSPVVDNSGYNLNRYFYLAVGVTIGPKATWTISQYSNPAMTPEYLLSSNNFLMGSKPGAESNTFVEANTLREFVNTVPNIQLEFVSAEGSSDALKEVAGRVKNMDNVLTLFTTYDQWYAQVVVDSTNLNTNGASVQMKINEGTDGGKPSADSIVAAYNATKDYVDAYQVCLSHAHQWEVVDAEGSVDPSGYNEALTTIGKDVIDNFEEVLYVEIPKFQSDGSTPNTVDNMVQELERLQGMIGYAKNVAYFGGGLKYYDDSGALQDCDVLGSVVGLGDAAASQFGPWYSFAGMNRGVLADANGPVIENLGSPSKVAELQTLAEWYMNVMVMKETRSQGIQTMLWHCFSSNPKDDSEKFLSVVRLNLYLKKNLRPLLEAYIEEPNTFTTWKEIYLEAADILNPLVGVAMTEYTWMGDQDATTYSELQVNNEADVRQGKYKVVLKYKDIVPMQEITMNIVIDSASRSVSIDTEE